MKYIIEINNLTFGYDDVEVFNQLKLRVREGSFTTILGPNGSGKTTLLKLILGLVKGNSVIMCEGLFISDESLKVLRRKIGAIYEKTEDTFVAETVMDEIAFSLENLNMTSAEIKKKINSIANKLKIKSLLEKNPYSINKESKWLVALASEIIVKPDILIIDNGFNCLHPSKRKVVLDVLKKYNEEGMTIINLTSDADECLYGDDVIVLNGGKVILTGSKDMVFKNEDVFDKMDMDLPFVVSLSNKLNFYDLIDEIYLSEEKLVDELWK